MTQAADSAENTTDARSEKRCRIPRTGSPGRDPTASTAPDDKNGADVSHHDLRLYCPSTPRPTAEPATWRGPPQGFCSVGYFHLETAAATQNPRAQVHLQGRVIGAFS
jgi:hypothetical protein